MDIRKFFAQRLRQHIDELGLQQREVAERMPSKPSASAFSQWMKGINYPRIEQALELAEALGLDPSYLLGLSDTKRAAENVYLAPRTSSFSLPTGQVVILPNDTSMQFNIAELRNQGLDPEQQILLRANDNSMTPILAKGDCALVDREHCIPESRDIYAMLVGNKVWFRWICPELDGTFTVTAEDGEQQREKNIRPDALAELCIIGRVAHISRYR